MIAGVVVFYNEMPHLSQCLRSLRGVCDFTVALDGSYVNLYNRAQSLDGSVEVAQKYADVYTYGVFDNQVHKRNMALEIAQNNGAEWVLVLDGDERLYQSKNAKSLHELLKYHDGSDTANPGLLRYESDRESYAGQFVPRLFRLSCHRRYSGAHWVLCDQYKRVTYLAENYLHRDPTAWLVPHYTIVDIGKRTPERMEDYAAFKDQQASSEAGWINELRKYGAR